MSKASDFALKRDENHRVIQKSGQSMKYQATAAANVIVKASAGYLERVIIGAHVNGGVLEISDHASDGDGNIKIKITGDATNTDAFPKSIEIGAEFSAGISADIASFTDITFIYR